jgi:hypothetical protein
MEGTVVGTGLGRYYGPTPTTVESVIEKEGSYPYFVGPEIVEDLLSIEGTIIVAYPGMIPAHNKVCASIVLSDQGMEYGFPGPCIAHGCREDGQQHSVRRVVRRQ